MGASHSKKDVYLGLCKDLDDETQALASFSTLEKAKNHVPKLHYDGHVWIEKMKVDSPGFYETEEEFIVWSSEKHVACA